MNNLIIMFEERMSSGQLFEEYYADLQDIQTQTINFDQTDYVLKYLWKRRKKLQVAITKVFTSQRGNRYLGILVYVQTGEGQQKQWNWTSFHIGLMDTSKVCVLLLFMFKANKPLSSHHISFTGIKIVSVRFVIGKHVHN